MKTLYIYIYSHYYIYNHVNHTDAILTHEYSKVVYITIITSITALLNLEMYFLKYTTIL